MKVAEEVERKLVGTTTADNVEIKEYTTHFIDRVIGSYEQKREPVSIKDVSEALKAPQKVISRSSSERMYIHEKNACKVGVNPSRGRLVQVSPKQKGV